MFLHVHATLKWGVNASLHFERAYNNFHYSNCCRTLYQVYIIENFVCSIFDHSASCITKLKVIVLNLADACDQKCNFTHIGSRHLNRSHSYIPLTSGSGNEA